LIDEILKPVVDWREVLARFVHDVSKDDYRWNRPNKNYLDAGLYLPGLYSEKLGEIVVILDDSGSCQMEIPQFLSEAIGIFDMFPGCLLHLITCDTEPTHVLDWEQGQDEPTFEGKHAVYGGGGTSFVKPFDMIREKEWKAKAVIYLTDLDGEIPDISKDPGCPVLWICINERHKQEELPFGELVVFTALNKSGW
jgi:predicted metal-dependent peptidase